MPPFIRGKAPPEITGKILQRNKSPNDYKASSLLLSHLPIKHPPRSSETPAGPVHPRHGAYLGEDWQMDVTQMPVSQRYEHLLVIIDTFTGWIEGFALGLRRLRRQ